jgi:hypothetical protein
MFDFRLQVFYTVANRLSFTKAAEELYITQTCCYQALLLHDLLTYTFFPC